MVSSILDGMNVMSEHFSALYNMLALWGNFIPEWFPTLHLNPVFSLLTTKTGGMQEDFLRMTCFFKFFVHFGKCNK
jgi:hypothetical protein